MPEHLTPAASARPSPGQGWTQARRAAQSALVGSVLAGACLGWRWPHPPHDAIHLGGAVAGLLVYLGLRVHRWYGSR